MKKENLTQKTELLDKADYSWKNPMKATLTDQRFSDEDWIFERKLDGERCIAVKQNGKTELFSRNHKSLNNTYPEIVSILNDQSPSDFIMDGEIVAFDGDITSFSKLQDRMQIKHKKEAEESDIKVYYYAFDLPQMAEYNLSKLPLRERKTILKNFFSYEDPLRYTTHKNTHGEKYYNQACEDNWEGLIAKDSNSHYVHSRSKKWLKFKCVNQQELVIGGYTEPEGTRIGFGALLVGYYEKDTFKYAGKIGTGYSDKFLEDFSKTLQKHEQKESPFQDEINKKGVHFTKPELIAEIGFTEWTRDGKLRHPRFLGLRKDKKPEKVVREKV